MKNITQKIAKISFSLVFLTMACCGKTKDAPEQATLEASPLVPPNDKPKPDSSWLTDLGEARAKAEASHKPLFIDFSASWCAPCADLDETFKAPQVAPLLEEQFVTVKLDVSEQSEADKALMAQFSVSALPALLVVKEGTEVLRIETFVGPTKLKAVLQGVLVADEAPKEPL